MGCGGDREKGNVALEEKWDYVNLNDFKSESCWTPFSYFFLWLFLIISLAVYGVDTFTAVNLLAFSRWSGRVEPAIPFRISRWIFAVCIIVSFALLAYRWILAIRAIRSGSIPKSYLDPLAVRIQSVRVFGSKGQGWKRFLVFAELTKSKKGAEYVALYTYFSFQFWMNTIFADGPRQVINAITLYSVMKADLVPGGENTTKNDDTSPVLQFFNNIKILAEENNLQAVVLFGMLFTLVIWVLSVLKLLSAMILYLVFLFHHISQKDGTLRAYCRRKISTRLKRIVRHKVDKALAKGFQLQSRTATQPSLASSDSKPTLPDMDKGPIVTTLSRSTTETTMATLPPYTRSNSTATEKNPTLPNVQIDMKPSLTRSTTQSSGISESASLTNNATSMGYSPLDRQNSPLPPVPPLPVGVTPTRTGSVPSRSTPGPRTGPGAEPFNPFSPARDPYGPSTTPAPSEYFNGSHNTPHDDYYGGSDDMYGETGDYDYYGRSTTPYSQMAAPRSQGYVPHDPYQARSYTPASTGATPAPRADVQNPYQSRSYTPASAQDPYQARSYTPASAGAGPRSQGDSQNPYQARSYTPASTGANPQGGTQDPYQARSYTPASAVSAPRYQTGGQDPYQARSYTPASTGAGSRSMTPATYHGTPAPQRSEQGVQPPPRAYTPMDSAQSGSYTAFNPAGSASTPQPQTQRQMPSVPPGHRPFTRANTGSTSMNRDGPPAGYGFNRANTNQF
ncbi:hypothetical protein N7509_010415 [Penicillium cosmopolitanum]|uniref:Pheromone-regulated membrane protein n=1 Tax=Penicillium cosmopolitanum TaxID=1131564 RepID=A0A9X0B4I0_9EURO|nr:uncharacterized protein N7509_010415 [Penicillium cosmopolitanum]KAJ5387874.1 hypothetical protein N7509_010415 [Penicillium cosmopolitanum]